MAAAMIKHNPMGKTLSTALIITKTDAKMKPDHIVEEVLSTVTSDKSTLMHILKGYLKKNMIFHTRDGLIEKASPKSFKWFRSEGKDGVNDYWYNTDLLDNDMKVRYSVKGGDYEEIKRAFHGYLETYFKVNPEVTVKTVEGFGQVPVGKLSLVYRKKTFLDKPDNITNKELYNPMITRGCVLRLGDRDLLHLKKERPSKHNLTIPEGTDKLTLSMAVVLDVSRDTGCVTQKMAEDNIVFSVVSSSNRKKVYMGSRAVFPPLTTECTLIAHKQQLVCGYEMGKGVRITSHAIASTKQSKKRKVAAGIDDSIAVVVEEEETTSLPPEKRKRTDTEGKNKNDTVSKKVDKIKNRSYPSSWIAKRKMMICIEGESDGE